jgi:hypothetical protein
MMTLEARMARLNLERRAKIEARANELHREYLALRKTCEKLNLIQEKEEYALRLPKEDSEDTKADT